jgi:pSer/pThr/pTyr-binding forkhead associated (FHA) protein
MGINSLKIKLVIKDSLDKIFELTKPDTILGRKKADIIINDPKISASHALIKIKDKEIKIIDLDSTNGTFVNGKEIKEENLKNLDEINLGKTNLIITILEDIKTYKEKTLSKRESASIDTTKESIENLINEELEGFSRWDVVNENENPKSFTRTVLNHPTQNIFLKILTGPDKGKQFKLSNSKIIIGRSGADITLTDTDISRKHAQLEIQPGEKIYLRDLASTNGSFVNRKKIIYEELKNNDLIELGSTVLKIEINP